MTRVYFSEGSNFFTPVFGLNFLVGPKTTTTQFFNIYYISIFSKTNSIIRQRRKNIFFFYLNFFSIKRKLGIKHY